MEKIRLVIVSEDVATRRGLNSIFSIEEAFDVQGCISLSEALDKSINLQPDVMLMDIHSEDIYKYGQKISKIKQECPCSMIIALVENEQIEKLAEVLDTGIDSCIPRNIMRGCLVKTIELTCQAGIFCMPGSFRKIVLSNNMLLDKSDKNVHLSEFCTDTSAIMKTLTQREKEVLQLMAQNYSNREIASKLFISEPTVKTHVSSILRKLGQSNRAQAIVYSYKAGLIDDTAVDPK
ncbi:Response regulator protein VraR [Sporotomaculum syntrophicum]|uniref:Stage 0 sporulation protein A homolog n=1 Tax=Sporotomaculum syntrophicum TaxID=182264 RepID=A0A9D2WS02_9FIRM|nr:response regulator transcription factor [Sporotomaculum syntrophicum]KAF1086299.1 Response regulator protein VraR [Sporotomaculum syntrophicum]